MIEKAEGYTSAFFVIFMYSLILCDRNEVTAVMLFIIYEFKI